LEKKVAHGPSEDFFLAVSFFHRGQVGERGSYGGEEYLFEMKEVE